MSELTEELKSLLSKWSSSEPWGKVAVEYANLAKERESIDRVLDSLSKDVADLLSEVKLEERRNLELQIATANKISPQNVTEEMVLSYSEMLSEENASLRRIARSTSKKYGRPLLQMLHPDKGGDALIFDIVKKAVAAGDNDLLRLFLYNLKGTGSDPSEVLSRVRGRQIRFSGSRVHHVCRMAMTGNRDQAVSSLRNLLSQRLALLKKLNTPGAFNEHQP